MAKYIIADNQELTCYALERLILQDEHNQTYRASDKAGLVCLLKEHENAVVLFDITDEEQLLIIGERLVSQRAMEVIISGREEEEKPDLLTATETEIVKAIAQGKTTKEIAAERFSSIHTVTTHRKNIFRKLGVNTAHEVVKYAIRSGLVDTSEFYI